MDEKIRQKAEAWARKKYDKIFKESQIEEHQDEFPKFDYEEVECGKILGKGGFGTVYEVRAFNTDGIHHHKHGRGLLKARSRRNSISGKEPDAQAEDGQTESRAFIAEHCIRNNGDARYALKILSHDTVEDMRLVFPGMVDMAIETRVLADIEHPNIVKLRALAKCEPYSDKYFIVMDRLYDTLENRIEKKWKGRNRREHGVLRDRSGEKSKALYEERLAVSYELAHAFEYLHDRKIVYRDIKPENIGFDIRDDVKLFDFGLAKELTPSLKLGNNTYKLTKMTGSPRYMAPEIAVGKPYNETCDCFSFAILLWEILTCEVPYSHENMEYLEQKVWTGPHERPPMHDDFHTPMKLLLTHSWGKDFHKRNSMHQNAEILRKELVRVRDGDESGLDQTRRRSTFVFRGSGASQSRRSIKIHDMNKTLRQLESS